MEIELGDDELIYRITDILDGSTLKPEPIAATT